ncbi:MAG: hypothetical protein K9G46_01035 [Flavobacteriales bacterium]|nr:hypothetical protein [Flavobacteriales bacterium]
MGWVFQPFGLARLTEGLAMEQLGGGFGPKGGEGLATASKARPFGLVTQGNALLFILVGGGTVKSATEAILARRRI